MEVVTRRVSHTSDGRLAVPPARSQKVEAFRGSGPVEDRLREGDPVGERLSRMDSTSLPEAVTVPSRPKRWKLQPGSPG